MRALSRGTAVPGSRQAEGRGPIIMRHQPAETALPGLPSGSVHCFLLSRQHWATASPGRRPQGGPVTAPIKAPAGTQPCSLSPVDPGPTRISYSQWTSFQLPSHCDGGTVTRAADNPAEWPAAPGPRGSGSASALQEGPQAQRFWKPRHQAAQRAVSRARLGAGRPLGPATTRLSKARRPIGSKNNGTGTGTGMGTGPSSPASPGAV